MKRALAALLAVSLLGCFEEELTLTLQPDGQGSLRLERTLSAPLSRTITDEAHYAAHTLAEWRGVVAWSDVVAERRDGRVTVAGTAWFRDANLLRRTTPRDGLRVSVLRGPGMLDVAVVEEPGMTGERLLAAPDREPDRRLLAQALAGFQRRVTLALPGEAIRPLGLEPVKDERERVAFLRGRAAVETEARALNALARDLATRIAAKATNSDSASKVLNAEIQKRASHTVRCDVKPGAGSSPQFRRDLTAAIATWRSSPWAEKVRAERGVMGETTLDAPLDPFEPNETDETAAELSLGAQEGLLCSGEDWYRVSVPAGKELHVDLGFEHAEGDLDLEIFGPVGASRSASQDDGEAASLTVLEESNEVLVRVHGAWAPYTLSTRLLDAQEIDVHEPNDSFEAAKPLTPDRYSGLRCNGEDWYRVEVPAESGLRVEITAPAEAGDLDLALHGADRRLLGESIGRTGSEAVILQPGPARTVFVRVFGANAIYAFTLDLTEEANDE